MIKLGRYLNAVVLRLVLITLFSLTALYMFFDFMGQLNDIGKGQYQLAGAILYIILQTPSRFYELLPIAVLMGTTFALSLLNAYSEIAVMRAAGVAIRKILIWLTLSGFLCAGATFLLGEYAVPYSEHQAEKFKLQETNSVLAGQFSSGIWVKDKHSFINIDEVLPDLTLKNIYIYIFDNHWKLVQLRQAQTGLYQGGKNWRLLDTIDTVFLPNNAGVTVQSMPSFNWHTTISPGTLAVLMVMPEKMSIRALYTYIHHLKDSKQKGDRYEIAFWSKIFYPFTCLVMIVIALPFSLGQRRSANIGLKLSGGILIGLGFYFFSRITAYIGQLYEWPPLLLALLPSLLFLAISGYLLYRQQRH